MKCDAVRQQLALMLYGELSFDEEELLEHHMDECADCRAERKRMEAFSTLLEEGEAGIPAGLLARCRRDLVAMIEESQTATRPRPTLAGLWNNWVIHPPLWLRPFGALTMLAIGFTAARMVPAGSSALSHIAGTTEPAPIVSRVRFVNPSESGKVQVLYDETRQREMTGASDDDPIRRLLLAAASDPGDPGLRVESLDILKQHCSDEEVRKALLNALRTDTNSGVRLKALEGLRSYARDPETRNVLAQVVLTDDNPGVRTQAIDMLVQNKEPEVVGVLQELLRHEENSYVRSRSQKALSEMKASQGTF